MPCAVSSRLDDDKLFIRPKHNFYTFFLILFGLFDFMLLFVCPISLVNCETEQFKITENFQSIGP